MSDIPKNEFRPENERQEQSHWDAPAPPPPQQSPAEWEVSGAAQEGMTHYADDDASVNPALLADSAIAKPQHAAPPGDLESDPRYKSVLVQMQYGRWPEVLEILTELKSVYPDEPILDSLINEAHLKSAIVIKWGTKIKGRRMTVRQERVLRRSIPFVLLIALAFLGLSFYQGLVAPSRHVVAMDRQHRQIVEEAQMLTQNGQFEEALYQYELVLASDPNNAGARQGIQETRDIMALVAQFDLAMQLADDGNIDRALTFLQDIQQKSPGFRNVDVQIKQLESMEQARLTFEAAETAYAQGQWLEAVPLYEEVSEMARDFHADTVDSHLKHAYLQAGLELVGMRPSPDAGPLEAQEYLRRGKAVDTQLAEMHLKRLDIYFDGLEALDRNDLNEAINLWQGLYDADPTYLGGYLAGRLYAAYLSLGAEAELEHDYTHAQNLYEQALSLQVDDITNAQNRLTALIAAATPTPAPVVQQAAPAYVPPPQPTPTPEPDLTGWIAFRTNRNGSEEIYVMRPDGSEQKPAHAGLAIRFEELLVQDRISWDGSRELRVMSPNGRTDANIYLADLTLPEGQPRETMITDFNGDEYDPVWSPQGDRIAFVANHTGNDEIWVANANGTDAYQVTWNEWEWDKRPSFSPDGSQIVFYSNRSGWPQIWVMDANGGTQYNLSYNAYDDWDPVWIK